MRLSALLVGTLLAFSLLNATSAQSCGRWISATASPGYTDLPFPFGGPHLWTPFPGGAPGGVTAIYFDVTAAAHLHLGGIEMNIDTAAASPKLADVYYRSGSHAGHEGSTAGWIPWTTARGELSPAGRFRFTLDRSIFCAGNFKVGIAVVARNFTHQDSYGTGINYSNADIRISGGATGVPFGSTTTQRVPNVSVHYKVDNSSSNNIVYQTIMRSGELGGAGNITDLAFRALYATGPRHHRVLRIRMAHRPAGWVLSPTFASNISGYTEVLHEDHYTWRHRRLYFEEIGLTAPFAYDGNSDVVVEIFSRGGRLALPHPPPLHWGTFHTGPNPFTYASGWTLNAPPTTGQSRTSGGIEMRADFECAETGEFGYSCGPAYADGYSTPIAGTDYWFDIHRAVPGSAAILTMGLNLAPQNLSSSGFTNCWTWTDGVAAVFKTTGSTGTAWHHMPLPNTTAFDGMSIYGYWVNLDPSQPGGMTFTNYVRMMIGQQGFPNPNQ